MTVIEGNQPEIIENYDFGKKKRRNKMNNIPSENIIKIPPVSTGTNVVVDVLSSSHSHLPSSEEITSNSTTTTTEQTAQVAQTREANQDDEDLFKLKKEKKKNLNNLLKDEDTSDNKDCIKCDNETLNASSEENSSSSVTVDEINADENQTDFTKFKKKRKNKILIDINEDQNEKTSSSEWQEYTYDELLDRLFKLLKEKNPEMLTQKRIVVTAPNVARLGTKKTAITNFGELCSSLNRDTKHLFDFFEAELGTKGGSINEKSELILKGRYSQPNIETVLRKYIKEYVKCRSCQSPQTNLIKEDRIVYLQCDSCTSRCSVSNVKSGFQAQVGKRAAQKV